MARIRSVHPTLFTDEAFVSLSDAAQIFLIGLWTEADDQGAFEWKPITLRIRLRAGKDGPVEPLLAELESSNCIRKYEIEGRKLGAIRNFRRFQKPKTPNATHVINDDFRNYVGLNGVISEMDADDEAKKENSTHAKPPLFPPKGEKSSLMEDGGDSRKREKKTQKTRVKNGHDVERGRRWGETEEVPQEWRDTIPDLRARASLSPIDVNLASENFARYWRSVAGANGVKRNWRSTYENNMLDENFRHPAPRKTQAGVPPGMVKDQLTGALVPAMKV